MDELLRIFVLGVEWFALWLEHSPLHVAWPVLFVALFQAFLSVVHVLQWYARGMFLRMACDYPVTTSKGSSPSRTRRLGNGTAATNIATVGCGALIAMRLIRICLGGRRSGVAASEWSASTATAREWFAPDPARSACSITAATHVGRPR
jgi:hypothetical protein